MNKKLYDAIVDGNVHYFYTSWPWKIKRKQILERDNRECQICKQDGKVTAGTLERDNRECQICKQDGKVTAGTGDNSLIVHHVQELKTRPDLALTDSNLLTVCNDCHENVCHPNRLGKYQERKSFMNEERWE